MNPTEGTAPAESSLPWLWVIEYLASFKRVNLKLLHGIIQSAPGLHDELEKNVRESVTLKCLEQLCGPANVNEATCDVASNSDSSPNFELSQSCEDVLRGILQEGSISDFIMRGNEPLKSQVRQFIMQKRISMHQPAIQQLKDAILKGTHPDAASLSGLASLTDDHRDNVGHSDILLGDPDGRGDNNPNMGANGNPNSAEHDREEPQLERNSRKRNSTLPNSENLAENSQENQQIDDDFAVRTPTAKKLKQSVPGATQPKKAASLLVNESDSKSVTNAELAKFDFAQDQMEASDEDGVVEETPEIRNERRGINGRLPAPSEVGGPVKESTARGNLGTILDATDALSAGEFQQREVIVEDAMDLVDQQHTEELSSDSDGYLNEEIDVSTRDSLENLMCIEQDICMKCKDGGQLLVCHTNRCPLAVHENCVDSLTSFDENGNFVCPFCQYSNATLEYFEAKKEAASAREDLAASLTAIFKQQPQNLSGTWRDDSQNQIDELAEVPEGPYNSQEDGDNEQAGPSLNGDLGNGVSNQLQKVEGSEGRAETSEQNSDLNSTPLVVKKKEQVSDGAATAVGSEENEKNNILQSNISSRDEEKQVNGKVQERQSGGRLEGLNGDVVAGDQGTGSNLGASKTGPSDGTSVDMRDQREALPSDTNEPLRKPGCALHVDGEENSEDDIEDADADEEPIISNYTISRQTNRRVSTSPVVARLRRTKPPWTEEEVKILKEGVEKYRDADSKTIPWKKILEFGASVFILDRTARDLKNKWRASAGAQN